MLNDVIERLVKIRKMNCFFFKSLFDIDCSDGTDENNPFQPCVYPQCPEGQFTCNNFRCIDNFKRCNGMCIVNLRNRRFIFEK
jgi:hypothetical protein